MNDESVSLILVRGEPLRSGDIEVTRPTQALEMMNAVIERAKLIKKVSDPTSQNRASLCAAELKGILKNLKLAHDTAKNPLLATTRALDQLSKELQTPIQEQYNRMDRLVSGYQDELRRERELAEAKERAEKLRLEQEAAAKIHQLELEREQARIRARLAEERAEREKAEKEGRKLDTEIRAKEVELQLEKENLPVVKASIAEQPIPGGRKWTQYICKLIQPMTAEALASLFENHPEVLRIELRDAAAQALAKTLDEAGKPLMVEGLTIQKQTRSSFQGAAAIRIHDNE
jgi:hypothetical protein